MGFIVRQPDCRTADLQVETTRESSRTGGPATEVDERSKVGDGGGGEVEIAGIESQTAKCPKSRPSWPPEQKFQFYDLSF